MDKNRIIDNLKYSYPMALNPVQPLVLWNDATKSLEKYYKQNGIDSMENWKDIKNTMRHITGSALLAKTYGYFPVRPITNIKESIDLFLDFLEHPKEGISQKELDDMHVDYNNNSIGRDYISRNPLATKQEIMDFAYNVAKNKNRSSLARKLSD